MEVLTGPAVLHATDVVVVNHGAGRFCSGSFNLVGNRTFSSAKACIRINGNETDLFMLQNPKESFFEFPGGKHVPEMGALASLPLSIGMNTLEFYIPSGSSAEAVTASAAVWVWEASDRVVVVDIDGAYCPTIGTRTPNCVHLSRSLPTHSLHSLVSEH
jgi:phosphatidate phosphatase PAH1